MKDSGELGRDGGRRRDARWASGSCGCGRPTWRCAAAAACASLALTASGCGGEQERGTTSLAERQAQLDRDPYAITCGDIEDRVASTRLSKRVQYALADDAKIPGFNRLGAGQSIFFAMTELCKGEPGSYKPAKAAIAAVRRGEFRADVGASP